MGIFSRFSDIVSSNFSAMLDKAEDPEKLIKLMIREMEDTLVEIKSSCAGAMAKKVKAGRDLVAAEEQVKLWSDRAELAMGKNRDDLAREALLIKREAAAKRDAIKEEEIHLAEMVEKYRSDISELQQKLDQARQKHTVLVQRHVHAKQKTRAQKEIRKTDSHAAMIRFEQFESRIERMEADADLVNLGAKKSPSVADEFSKLEGDSELEAELEALRKKTTAKSV